MTRFSLWVTAPERLSKIVIMLIVTSFSSMVLSSWLVLGVARLDARAAANEAATRAAKESACQILSLQIDPSLPSPATPRGQATLEIYRAAYVDVGC